MKRTKNRKFLKVAITFSLIVAYFSTAIDAQCTTNIGCADCFTWCSGTTHLCNQPLVQAYCRESCQACPSTADACTALNCAQRCILSEDRATARCGCFDSYKLDEDGKTCIDIDECAWNGTTLCKDEPGGSHCVNTEGGHVCVACQALGNPRFQSYYNREECCLRNIGEECGKSYKNPSRIVGGKDMKIRRWPWTAYIKTGERICGGSLITRNHIVTAGHCVEGRVLSELRVLLGVEDTSDGSNLHVQTRSVAQVLIHPDYNSPQNDIAILVLSEPAYLSNYVSTICLPNGEEPQVGEMCYAVGYGATTHRDKPAVILKEVNLPIIDEELCNNAFANETNRINSSSQMCAGYSEGGRDMCQGNSGGPIMCQRCNSCDWYLTGVTSYGIECARPRYYGVYSRVKFFEEWITGITNQPYSPQACVKTSWHAWGAWTKCSVSCGVGSRSRVRFCMNGSAGDPGCIGNTSETRNCNMETCADWSQWSQCSVTCGNGVQTRSRGNDIESRACNERSSCPAWGEYQEWSVCSASCGVGVRTSTRQCINGMQGETGCLGLSERREECNTQCCPSWSGFTPFSSCSVSCGGGFMISNRSCLCGKIGDVGCEGISTRQTPCAPEECPRFTQWTEFDSCSAQCDGGIKIRTRSCSRLGLCAPDKHGDILNQTLTCNTQPCLGRWGPFSEFGSCSVSCGGGTQSRTRQCIDGVVGSGNCIGDSTEEKPCNTESCSIQSASCSHLTNTRQSASCCNFADQGFCSIYKQFMSENCEKACCEYQSGEPCSYGKCVNILDDASCQSIANSCSHPYVQSYCKKTCNLC